VYVPSNLTDLFKEKRKKTLPLDNSSARYSNKILKGWKARGFGVSQSGNQAEINKKEVLTSLFCRGRRQQALADRETKYF
jgi:hypothetical protein